MQLVRFWIGECAQRAVAFGVRAREDDLELVEQGHDIGAALVRDEERKAERLDRPRAHLGLQLLVFGHLEQELARVAEKRERLGREEAELHEREHDDLKREHLFG